VVGAIRANALHAKAMEVLDASAADEDPMVRGMALRKLIELRPSPDWAAWGQRATWDPEEWVQRQGVEAIAGHLPDSESVNQLRGVLERANVSPFVRCRAAMHLVQASSLGGEFHRSLLASVQEAAASTRQPQNRSPCWVVGAVLGDADMATRLAAMLADGEVPLDLMFVDDLGRSDLSDMVESIESGMEWFEEPMEIPMASVLFRLGSDLGEARMTTAFRDPMVEPGLEALDLLANVRTERTTRLIEVASRSTVEEVQLYARLILTSRGKGKWQWLDEAAQSNDRETRLWAAQFVGDAAEATWDLEELQADLSSNRGEDWQVANAVVDRLLGDSEWLVVAEAASSAMRMGVLSRERANKLEVLLLAEDAEVRVAIAAVLLNGSAPKTLTTPVEEETI